MNIAERIAPSAAAAFDLSGQVAVVTGAGRGLGLAMAKTLAGAGATVVLAGRSIEALERAAGEIQEQAGQAQIHPVHVESEPSVEKLEAFAWERFGRVDILVNNAGINPFYKAPEDTPLEEWQSLIDVNLTGVFLCCRVFGRRMIAQRRGSIINITSIAGHVGLRKSTAYCASKGGVELMTKSLALDWAPKGVRVNAIAPGYFETDLTAGLRQHPILAKRLLDQTPMGRFGLPDDLAGALLFLASDASAYVTGQSITVDGGWTAA